MKEKTDRQVIFKVQPSLYKEFEAKCDEEHRSVSEVIRELMSKYSRGWNFIKGSNIMEVIRLDVPEHPGCQIEFTIAHDRDGGFMWKVTNFMDPPYPHYQVKDEEKPGTLAFFLREKVEKMINARKSVACGS